MHIAPARSLHALLAAACLAAPMAVCAQDGTDALDMISVTGSRIAYDDLLETPAVSVTKPGDFLLLNFTLVNDSRDEDAREREVHDTILQMVNAAGGRYTLFYTDEARIALNRDNHRVELDDGTRPDTSQVNLQVRVAIGGDPTRAEALITEMRKFLRTARMAGRTEVIIKGETSLQMNKPERYRYEIIEAIAADSRKLMDSMGLECTLQLEGLNGRIQWERASAAELLLYIPYSMTITDCRKAAGTR